MPYTPPTQRSPASSKPNSPIISRNHSYTGQPPTQPVSQTRPNLPRSVSSTSYLHKHRRTPSVPTHSTNGHVVNGHGSGVSASRRGRGSSASGSLRQSPPPVNNSLIPSGAVTTPPDSSDDEEERRSRLGNLKELQEALQKIDVKRGASPSRNEHRKIEIPARAAAIITSAPSLSAEARKISHSRSASEITLSQHVPNLDTAPVITSSETSDAEDDELRMKPPLVRKKSGELVKPALRPSSGRRRPSSMPGTPTFSKAVHFNDNIEQVRQFFTLDRPMAVSAGSSPVETYDDDSEYPFGYEDGYRPKNIGWEIKLANFPGDTFERKTAPVRIERIFLASDHKTLVGTVAVANIAFHKSVAARFTLDYWKTVSEVAAEYNHDIRKKQTHDGYDRFNFNIKLADQANLESKTLLLCVRYNVNGQEFWDNNNSMNYQVDFVKKMEQKKSGSGTNGAIPRSRHTAPAPRPRSMPPGSFDDDFDHSFGSKYSFGQSRDFLRDSSSQAIPLKPKSKRGSLFPDQASSRRNPSGQAFSSRYDFTNSLTAAKPVKPENADVDPVEKRSAAKPSVPVPGTRPDTFSLEKPDLKSAEYNELIQKFCFFGTPSKNGSKSSSPVAQSPEADGTMEPMLQSSSGSDISSSSNSPPSPALKQLDGAGDLKMHFSPRTGSPGPVTGSGPEDHMNSHFQYGYNRHGAIFTEASHTPQACM